MQQTEKVSPKITPKKKVGPPSRKQRAGRGLPSKNQSGGDSVVARLQQLIMEKDDKIVQLTERINNLAMENKSLQTKIENLKKATGGIQL